MASHDGVFLPPPNVELPPPPPPHAQSGGEPHDRIVLTNSASAANYVWTLEPEGAPNERVLPKADEQEED